MSLITNYAEPANSYHQLYSLLSVFIAVFLFIGCPEGAKAAPFSEMVKLPPPPPGITPEVQKAFARGLAKAERAFQQELSKNRYEREISQILPEARQKAQNAPTKEEGRKIWQNALKQYQKAKDSFNPEAEISESEFREYLQKKGKKEDEINKIIKNKLPQDAFLSNYFYPELQPLFEENLARKNYGLAKAIALWQAAFIIPIIIKPKSTIEEYEDTIRTSYNSNYNLGELYTKLGDFKKAISFFKIPLKGPVTDAEIEKLCKDKVKKILQDREVSKKSKAKKNAIHTETIIEPAWKMPEAPANIPEEAKELTANILPEIEKAYRNALAAVKIDSQIQMLSDRARENRAQTKENKIRQDNMEKAAALKASKKQMPEITEKEFREFLEDQFLTPEAVNFKLNQAKSQKEIFARKKYLEILAPLFEKYLQEGKYKEAEAIANWQLAIAHSSRPNLYTVPDNEYAHAQAEVIPYYKNLGRIFTAQKDWRNAAHYFGIHFPIKPEEGMVEALCYALAKAAKEGHNYRITIIGTLNGFKDKAWDDKNWDLAEKIVLWQIDLANMENRYPENRFPKEGASEDERFEALFNSQNSANAAERILMERFTDAALIQKEKGNDDKAIEYFLKVISPTFFGNDRIIYDIQAYAATELAHLYEKNKDMLAANRYSSRASNYYARKGSVKISTGRKMLEVKTRSHKALGELGEALKSAQNLINLLGQANVPQNKNMAYALTLLGNIQQELGNKNEALQNYKAALQLYEADNHKVSPELAALLLDIYVLNKEKGKNEKELLQKANTANLPPLTKARLNLLLADVFTKDKKEYNSYLQTALNSINKAMQQARHPDASILYTSGDINLKLGQTRKAIEDFQQAFILYNLGYEKAEAVSCAYGLLKAYAALGDNKSAIFWGKIGINELQRMRANIRLLAPEAQLAFMNARQYFYQDLIDVLQREFRLNEAQHIYSLLKQEEIRQYASGEAQPKSSLPKTAMAGIEQNINDLLQDTLTTLSGINNAVDTAKKWQDKVEYGTLMDYQPIFMENSGLVKTDKSKEQDAVKKGGVIIPGDMGSYFIYLTPENQEIMRQMLKSQNSKLPYERKYPEEIEISPATLPDLKKRQQYEEELIKTFLAAIPQTLKEKWQPDEQEYLRYAAKHLDKGTVLLHASSGSDNTWIWLTDDNGKILQAKVLPVTREELRRHVMELRQLITERKSDPRPKCKEFYDWLIGPVEEELNRLKPKTLLFSLDNVLRYVPPAILFDGKQWLLEKYATGVFLEASKDSLNPKSGGLNMGGMGVTEQYGNFPALPGVERELETIVLSKDTPNGIIPGQIYLNDAFTEKSLADVLNNNASILHLATHFKLDPESAKDSFLLLGDGSKLSLPGLVSDKFKFDNLRQISLSACETGIGSKSTGSEIESLGTIAQEKGAQSVLATLWPISDTASSILMPLYYKNLMQGKSRAEALRQAQLALIKNDWEDQMPKMRGDKYPILKRRDLPGRSHPFYWGAFILMGNWQ